MDDFDVIIGYEDEKQELRRICDIMRNPERYSALGVTTPKGLLIKGSPGLGKTLMAKTLASASGRKVFACRKDMPDGAFVNEIRKTFENAKKESPSIVFLDDMDRFANEDIYHRNAEEFVTIQSCIDDCKNHEVFVLATANEILSLPESLLRPGRFDKTLWINPPRYEDALKIVSFYLQKKSYVSDVNVEEITKLLSRRSCAELETVINEAGIFAGYEGKDKIEMNDIIRAILRVIFDAPESYETDKEYEKKVAYHEAGHAVIGECLETGSVNLVSIAAYNGQVRGICSFFEADRSADDSKYMKKKIMRDLGGRAASELVFGQIDSGSAGDLDSAFDTLGWYLTQQCKYGFGFYNTDESGNNISDRKDIALEIEMERFYTETKIMLAENREFLNKMTEALLEKKTLLRKDIELIKKKIDDIKA